MPDWPSNFAVYAIDPQGFYFMSIDPYTTNSLITGRAQQQNLTNIASNPFGTQNLLLYGNVTSTTSFSTKGPNGQIRVELQLSRFSSPAPSPEHSLNPPACSSRTRSSFPVLCTPGGGSFAGVHVFQQ